MSKHSNRANRNDSSTEPTVLDPTLSEDGERILLSAERDDVSVMIEAPSDLREDELDAILNEIPESVTRTVSMWGESR